MAITLPFTLLPGQEESIINFLNRISDPTEITDNTQLEDDPFYNGAGGYAIGDRVATNIINYREKLVGGRFRSIEQVLEVQGLGHDKVRDLLSSFWKPAATFFEERLRVFLLDNWKIEHWSYDFTYQEETFERIASDACLLRSFVVEKVEELIRKRHNNGALAKVSAALLRQLPLDRSSDAFVNAHSMALWWYKFDADNWFSFDRMLEATQAYFDYYHFHEMSLAFFNGFVNGGTLAEAVTTDGLPVVVNHGEKNVTIWAASLFD